MIRKTVIAEKTQSVICVQNLDEAVFVSFHKNVIPYYLAIGK